METVLEGIVLAGVVVAGGVVVVVFGVVVAVVVVAGGVVVVVFGVVVAVVVVAGGVVVVVFGVVVAVVVVAGVVVAGVVVPGVVVLGVEADGSGVWSTIVGSARTPLSATTGCADVAKSVDSSVGIKMGSTGTEFDDASITFAGSGAVARHCFLPFASPHTQTTAFFLRTFPGVEHATDFPLAEMVAYQILLAGVFAHTTDTLETFVT
jgi:hypothetical protein